MPIYEFYCRDCHTVYSFFSNRVATDRQPACPRCSRAELERRPSTFATLKHREGGDGEDDDPFAGLDESKLEGAMDSLMREMGGLDEEDPRAMGRMMRRFGELTGLEMGGKLEEMTRRLEAGEDPDGLEQEFGDDLGDEDSMEDFFKLKKALGDRRSRRPRVDDELYFF